MCMCIVKTERERESNVSFKNKCLLKTIAAAVDLGANYFFKKMRWRVKLF